MAGQDEKGAKPASSTGKRKQAVIVIHGMGEQIPMQTLRSFVEATWITDGDVVEQRSSDKSAEEIRQENPVWSKPDRRNRSYELRRITTETSENDRRTDFYEFYWAHLMHGTTWEHFRDWFRELLLRPVHRVPRDVLAAWFCLWAISIAVVLVAVYALLPVADLRQCWAGACDSTTCNASALCWTWMKPVVTGSFTLVVAFVVNVLLLKSFGDVARYVRATPVNVARRQEIREQGVQLLETLMGVEGVDVGKTLSDGKPLHWDTEYDRIIVVAHSLGSIIAYDILKHAFARINRYVDDDQQARQPKREELEALLRDPEAFSLDKFQELQRECREELNELGNPWIVSDFITLGSPLTHAEFLMAYDDDDMREQQQRRILPTCPPMLEWDSYHEQSSFTYWPGSSRRQNEHIRLPHHAAHFAFTRWTNIYSKARNILWGDLISGPLGEHFGLKIGDNTLLKGIRDVQVLSEEDENGFPIEPVPFFTHTKYWDLDVRAGKDLEDETPFHIQELRRAMKLAEAK